MKKSIINNNSHKCYLCSKELDTEIFYCIPIVNDDNIKKAKEDGLYVFLCKKHETEHKKNGQTIIDEGCINIIEREHSFKKMLIGIGEDKWKEENKALHKDFMDRYGK